MSKSDGHNPYRDEIIIPIEDCLVEAENNQELIDTIKELSLATYMARTVLARAILTSEIQKVTGAPLIPAYGHDIENDRIGILLLAGEKFKKSFTIITGEYDGSELKEYPHILPETAVRALINYRNLNSANNN